MSNAQACLPQIRCLGKTQPQRQDAAVEAEAGCGQLVQESCEIPRVAVPSGSVVLQQTPLKVWSGSEPGVQVNSCSTTRIPRTEFSLGAHPFLQLSESAYPSIKQEGPKEKEAPTGSTILNFLLSCTSWIWYTYSRDDSKKLCLSLST